MKVTNDCGKILNMANIDWNNDVGITDASSIDIPPGRWPGQITAKTASGVEQVFMQVKVVRDHENEVQYVEYSDGDRMRIRVFND